MEAVLVVTRSTQTSVAWMGRHHVVCGWVHI